MTNGNKPSVFRTIRSLITAVPAVINLITNIGTLIKLEARLAGKSLALILALSLVLGILLTTSWLCILSLFFLYLLSHQFSMEFSLFMILLVNLALLVMIVIIMVKAKKNLFFPATSRQLQGSEDS